MDIKCVVSLCDKDGGCVFSKKSDKIPDVQPRDGLVHVTAVSEGKFWDLIVGVANLHQLRIQQEE